MVATGGAPVGPNPCPARARERGPLEDRVIDLSVVDHPDPVSELRRLVNLKWAYDHLDRARARRKGGGRPGGRRGRRRPRSRPRKRTRSSSGARRSSGPRVGSRTHSMRGGRRPAPIRPGPSSCADASRLASCPRMQGCWPEKGPRGRSPQSAVSVGLGRVGESAWKRPRRAIRASSAMSRARSARRSSRCSRRPTGWRSRR